MYENYGETLTIADMSSILKISVSTAYRIIYNGEIPFFRAGKGIRVYRTDLLAYIERQRKSR